MCRDSPDLGQYCKGHYLDPKSILSLQGKGEGRYPYLSGGHQPPRVHAYSLCPGGGTWVPTPGAGAGAGGMACPIISPLTPGRAASAMWQPYSAQQMLQGSGVLPDSFCPSPPDGSHLPAIAHPAALRERARF